MVRNPQFFDECLFDAVVGTDIGNLIALLLEPADQGNIWCNVTGSPSAGENDMFHEVPPESFFIWQQFYYVPRILKCQGQKRGDGSSMDKDKLTDRRDLTEENIENIDDPQASSHFKRIFEEDGKMLEEEALASSYEVDEERKEALRLRILEAAAAQGLLDDEDVEVRDAAGSGNTAADDGVAEADEGKEGKKLEKKRRRSYHSMIRWAAVLALVCLGVLGASVTSQAKGSGLWSTIQRFIGVESRWQQENNGSDRTYTNPEEYKAINQIEEELGIHVPDFLYWPDGYAFSSAEILRDSDIFVMTYQVGDDTLYFEGRSSDTNISSTNTSEGKGETYYEKYEDVVYTIIELLTDDNEYYYEVSWEVNDTKYMLGGRIEKQELEKILKNIKN